MTNQRKNQLYFIALVPGRELREQVKFLKEEMKMNYGSSHALKSPAHITMQMPFRRPETDEQIIIKTLEEFCKEQTSFDIALNGFDCFAPRVIFIRIINHKPVISLHKKLNKVLKSDLNFSSRVLTHQLHPHMTIATRDLSEKAFEQAWPQYESREFEASFTVNSLFLLKHNGTHWDMFRELFFGD